MPCLLMGSFKGPHALEDFVIGANTDIAKFDLCALVRFAELDFQHVDPILDDLLIDGDYLFQVRDVWNKELTERA